MGTDAGKNFGLLSRVTDGNNCYRVYNSTGNNLQLRRLIGGATNAMGSTDYAWSPTDGVDYTVEIVVLGSSISVKLDGSTVIGPVTDTTYTSASQAGLRIGGTGAEPNTTTGWHQDSFEVDTVSAGSSSIAAISSGHHNRGLR
jgi:hypothetical protein